MYGHAKKCHVVIIKLSTDFRTWRILAAAAFWNKKLSKPGPLTMLLLHNYVCRSLKLLLPQSVRLKEQMAVRGWQVRCPGKAVPLPSSKIPVTAGPQWVDSFPFWVWGITNCQADQLFPAVPSTLSHWAGRVTLQHCKGEHRSCWCRSPSVTRQTWILLLPFCSSKWTHCLLIYSY